MYPFGKEQEPAAAATFANVPLSKRLQYSASFERDDFAARSIEEQKIKPKMIRPRNFEAPFKHILDETNRIDEHHRAVDQNDQFVLAKQRMERKYKRPEPNDTAYYDDDAPASIPYRYPSSAEKTRKSIERAAAAEPERRHHAVDEPTAYRENLTDKQKYHEALIDRQERQKGRMRHDPNDDFYEPPKTALHYESRQSTARRYERSPDRQPPPPPPPKERVRKVDSRHEMADEYDSMVRNPYKEADSLPYRESIEKMIKSPVMRYKTFDDDNNSYSDEDADVKGSHLKKYLVHEDNSRSYKPPPSKGYDVVHTTRRYSEEKTKSPPYPSNGNNSMSKHSPKDRFQDAKQKFQAMELDRSLYPSDKRRSQQAGRQSYDRNNKDHHRQHSGSDWTFDDAASPMPPPPQHKRGSHDYHMDGYDGKLEQRGPPKSLGNMVKGYRHSYAEPQNNPPMPRNSGRVGLAAVNPF